MDPGLRWARSAWFGHEELLPATCLRIASPNAALPWQPTSQWTDQPELLEHLCFDNDCFTPRHDSSLGLLSHFDLRLVIDLWAQQSEELGLRFPWVQIFENCGEAMGASNIGWSSCLSGRAWPFETLIIPRQPVLRLAELEGARDSLAQILIRLLGRYDNLFGSRFPDSMGWHQAPFVSDGCEGWQLHAHVPPLLRSATSQIHGWI